MNNELNPEGQYYVVAGVSKVFVFASEKAWKTGCWHLAEFDYEQWAAVAQWPVNKIL